MSYRKPTLISILLAGVAGVYAQAPSQEGMEAFKNTAREQFEQFKAATQREFEDFRRKANEDYARFMHEAWKPRDVSAPEPAPVLPEPPAPVVKDDTIPPPPTLLGTQPEAEPAPPAPPQPPAPVEQPEAPRPQPEEPQEEAAPAFHFTFYQTDYAVRQVEPFALPAASEAEVQRVWQFMSGHGYVPLADECLLLKERLSLNDWGYIELLRTLCEACMGASTNEAAVMRMFLLVQSGYKARMALADGRLALLVPFAEDIYGYSFLKLDGEKYYVLDQSLKKASFAVYEQAFPNEQTPTLRITAQPKLKYAATPVRTFASERYPEMQVSVSPNRNLLDFYNSYPLTNNWDYYAQASLSTEAKEAIYPVLRECLRGKSPAEAAERLLNFVQTAFDYRTDAQQFGYERPLFADETFYYPYADCEDRSVLFAVLVRDLLQLEVVLLGYPNHVATAVHFPDMPDGYYYQWEGKKYLVCDPTYINAPIGDCMPEYRQANARIVRISTP